MKRKSTEGNLMEKFEKYYNVNVCSKSYTTGINKKYNREKSRSPNRAL